MDKQEILKTLKTLARISDKYLTSWQSKEDFFYSDEAKKLRSKISQVYARVRPAIIKAFGYLPVLEWQGRNVDLFANAYSENKVWASDCFRYIHQHLDQAIAFYEQQPLDISKGEVSKTKGTGRVFVVHGTETNAKGTVARFLLKLKLNPIILHEQPNEGRTLIEKFEAHSDVEYAVVICLPDDVGYPVNEPKKLRPRARQNVILELGFFLGRLGRNKVCVLFSGNVELPSDYHGVVYIPFSDDQADWELKLAKELKNAGLKVDLNDVA